MELELIWGFLKLGGLVLSVSLMMAAYLFGMKIIFRALGSLDKVLNVKPEALADRLDAEDEEPEVEDDQQEAEDDQPEEAEAAPEAETQQEEVAGEDAVEVEEIFKHYVNRQALDLEALRSWIEVHFLPRLVKAYDWLALWRVLRDQDLFDGGMDKTEKFAKRMNAWFPKPPQKCVSGEINRYKRGYLGNTPHALWNKSEFLRQRDDKQSVEGFKRLDSLCTSLEVEFDLKGLLKQG